MGLTNWVTIEHLVVLAISATVSSQFSDLGRRLDIGGPIPVSVVHQDANQRSNTSKPPNSWRSLLPLHSSRSDVERLFGSPETSLAPMYTFESEAVLFAYAKGNCHPTDFGWNVPPGTILEITVAPKRTIRLTEMKVDLDKFERVEDHHTKLVYYTNLDDGVTLQTRMIEGCETVVLIKYGPSRRDLGLACPKD